jgi:hypothetical protein
MDVALFKTCSQRHHLAREHGSKRLRDFGIALEFS